MFLGTAIPFCAIVLVAAFVNGVTGFAFNMVVMLVLPHLFGYTKALAMASMMATLLLIDSSYTYRHHVKYKWLPLCAVTSAFGDLAGILVLKRVGNAPFWFTLMGAVFILMALYLLFGQSRLQLRENRGTLIVSSTLSGLIIGAFGCGVPIIAAFFLATSKTKEEYLGTVQMVSLITMAIDVCLRAINGMYTLRMIAWVLLGLVFIIIGILIAKRLVNRMNIQTMRHLVCIVMILCGGLIMLR